MKRWNATFLVLCWTFGFVELAPGQSQAVGPPVAGSSESQAGSPESLALRGGQVGRRTLHGACQFEVIFRDRSVEILVFDRAGMPVSVHNVRGRVVFTLAGDRRVYRYDLYAPGRDARVPNRLYLAVDLSRLPDRDVSVDVVLHGLTEQAIEFATPFQRALTPEQIAILRQRICPVSGKLLGSMGQPRKVTIDASDVFVCCQGCIRKVQERPDLYLSKITQPAAAATRR